MKCQLCGANSARTRRITRSYGKVENLLVIENIPVVSCPACAESYFTADTLRELERIKLHRKTLRDERRVAVAESVRTG
jgi:YgiT-type zinc finger domain-containing protein